MTDDAVRSAEPLRCPKCGNVLQVKWLVIDDEDGHDEVVCLDCSTSDYHRAFTAQQFTEIVTDLIAVRVSQEMRVAPR